MHYYGTSFVTTKEDGSYVARFLNWFELDLIGMGFGEDHKANNIKNYVLEINPS